MCVEQSRQSVTFPTVHTSAGSADFQNLIALLKNCNDAKFEKTLLKKSDNQMQLHLLRHHRKKATRFKTVLPKMTQHKRVRLLLLRGRGNYSTKEEIADPIDCHVEAVRIRE